MRLVYVLVLAALSIILTAIIVGMRLRDHSSVVRGQEKYSDQVFTYTLQPVMDREGALILCHYNYTTFIDIYQNGVYGELCYDENGLMCIKINSVQDGYVIFYDYKRKKLFVGSGGKLREYSRGSKPRWEEEGIDEIYRLILDKKYNYKNDTQIGIKRTEHEIQMHIHNPSKNYMMKKYIQHGEFVRDFRNLSIKFNNLITSGVLGTG